MGKNPKQGQGLCLLMNYVFFSVKTRIDRATFHSHSYLEYFCPICVTTLYYFGGFFMSQTIFESSVPTDIYENFINAVQLSYSSGYSKLL